MAVWVCSCLVILVKLCRVKARYGSLGTLCLGKSCSVLEGQVMERYGSCGTVRWVSVCYCGACWGTSRQLR